LTKIARNDGFSRTFHRHDGGGSIGKQFVITGAWFALSYMTIPASCDRFCPRRSTRAFGSFRLLFVIAAFVVSLKNFRYATRAGLAMNRPVLERNMNNNIKQHLISTPQHTAAHHFPYQNMYETHPYQKGGNAYKTAFGIKQRRKHRLIKQQPSGTA
jgi:hypothetical protein